MSMRAWREFRPSRRRELGESEGSVFQRTSYVSALCLQDVLGKEQVK